MAGYSLFVNGNFVAKTAGTSDTLTGLACGTTYSLGVAAYDAAGNVSGQDGISASTVACSPPPTAPDRFAVTSYDEMKGGAPHSGLTGYWYQNFTAASNTITYIGVTWGNGQYPGGQPVSGASTTIELCTSVGTESPTGVACNGMLAEKTATVVNEGNTAVDIGDIAVTEGSTYWVVTYQPSLSAGNWACYWWGSGTTVESSTVMQMVVRGYNR